MRDFPDLSSIIESRSEGPLPARGLMKVLNGLGLDGTDRSARDDQPAVLPTDVETSAPVDTGRKRSRDSDLGDQSGELNAIVGDLPDVPPEKKKKKSKKKMSAEEKAASDAEGVPQLRDEADDNLSPERDLGRHSPVTPAKKKRKKKKTKVDPEAEAQKLKEVDRADDRLGASEPRAPLPVDYLAFQVSYLDVVHQRLAADECVDALVMKYNAELKVSFVSLRKAHEEADRGKERVAVLEASLEQVEVERSEATSRVETLSMNAEDIASRLKSARGLLATLSAEILYDGAPASVNPHGSNVGLIDVQTVASLQSSEHSLGGRSGGSVGNPSVGQGVSEGSGKGSIAVASDSVEEEEEISGFDSDDGRDHLESDKARPTSEDVELQVSTTGASHPSPGQEGTKDADPAVPKE
ncbi:hypothetical protein Bca101_067760 [Brassica carinata]